MRHAPAAALAVSLVTAVFAHAARADDASKSADSLEDIYILRSIREHSEPVANWCSPDRTGFEPFPKDAERMFSFWSVQSRLEDGKVVDAKGSRVAELRACFGATSE